GGTADRNRSHWSTSKTPSYTKSVSWQHHQNCKTKVLRRNYLRFTRTLQYELKCGIKNKKKA
ncbi:hypothetical protein AADB79_22775, partial [Escherichia coli]|uniref:hypothetical protein n=1 Tax=Escherichia coli TaxID=562 RepID=UPI0039862EBB